MSTLYEYKQNARNSRVQMLEENFAKGMQFTNTPLPEGYVKLLINYDIFEDGASLKPRPGLRTTKAFVADAAVDSLGTEQIIAAKEQYVGSTPYAQFLLKHTMATGTTRLRDGQLRMLTEISTAPTTEFTGIPTKEYVSATHGHTNFVVPENAEIHGITLSDTAALARHVGTYAWNGQYYCFDSTNKKLVHTAYDDDAEVEAFVFVSESPKAITSKEAVTWGYNMLSDTPYTFANTAGTGVIVLTGMLPYDSDGNLCLTPVINQSLEFEVFFAVPAVKYTFVWEWRSSTGDTWATLKTETVTFTSTPQDITCEFSPPEQNIIMRVTAYGYTNDVQNTSADATLAVGFGFSKSDYGSTANIAPVTYNLFNASGMAYWQNRLMVWGVAEDPTILFASDVNDPTYFPYPNNCDSFDEPIKYALPFRDYFLVFTSTKLHMLALSSDGLSWTTTCIQSNLHISDWDCHLIQVVKNMLFFRSGNYYYMIVPKASSTTGELTLAAVSKPLYYFFDNFEENVEQIIEDTYNYDGTLTLIHYYNYLDFEDVHNVYVFNTDNDEKIYFCMLYNTVTRSWRSYTLGCQSMLFPYKADSTQRGTLCSLASIVAGATTAAAPQLLKFSATNPADNYIPLGVTVSTAATVFAAQHWVKNWQHLDTGYREHSSNFKKRYRELQFVLNNISQLALQFYSDFFIDGEQRTDRFTYQVVQDTDPESNTYGQLTVEKVLTSAITAPGTTALGTSESDVESWTLDVSRFPEVSFWKARLMVSGKGYTPRWMLTSRNEALYEFLNVSWVYRQLYSR